MRKMFIIVFFIFIVVIIFTNYLADTEKQDKLAELKEQYSKKHISSVDHSKFKSLQKDFNTPQEVTRTCISCHTERGKEVMKNAHWRWDREEFIEGRGVTYLGKKNLINNFCIGIGGSEITCTRCHAGYGWEDNSFDFSVEENIDCIICHDNSGNYMKSKTGAGYPVESVNLNEVVQKIGIPQRSNCGRCHFYGGGGNNVKHGDLEESLFDCTRDVDVHMTTEGLNMQCTDCHETENHLISGKLYSVSSMNRNRVTCEQCHTDSPHENEVINEHSVKVACQTCHIPIYAKVNSTKMTWDWSTAGKLKNGEPYTEKDSLGNPTYLSKKGSFTWAKDVEPEYYWFNGTADHYVIGDKVDTSCCIKINILNGDFNDMNSKIIPVKIHRAKQIYDCKNKMIIQPKLYAEKKGEGGYWKDFDWGIAAKLGMESVGSEYSGDFCFVSTVMFWPLNHMVSEKEKSLQCVDCHNRNGRLKNLTGFYMPGRDYSSIIDTLGTLIILLSLVGIMVHAGIRIFVHYKKIKV
jgi:octaheme c-type cytochrome (tetrathionate reductase family)